MRYPTKKGPRMKVENVGNNNIQFRKQIRTVEGQLIKAQSDLKFTNLHLQKTQLVLQNTNERLARVEKGVAEGRTELGALKSYVTTHACEFNKSAQHSQILVPTGKTGGSKTKAAPEEKHPSKPANASNKSKVSEAPSSPPKLAAKKRREGRWTQDIENIAAADSRQ